MRVKSDFPQRKAVERSFRNVVPGHYAPRLFCREFSGDTHPDLDQPVSLFGDYYLLRQTS